MSDVLKRTLLSVEGRTTTVTMVVFLMLVTGGCSSKRAVYIPSDWRSPAPPATAGLESGRARPLPGSPSQPIIEPRSRIHERDLGALPDKSHAVSVAPDEAEADELSPKSRGGATPETPQYVASMHLVNTAKSALQQGNAEQAIAQLEQAIQVDAYNAEAFFVLARAWQASGDNKRALEFARKAEILYQDEPQALKRVYLLEADLLKRSGQKSEAEIYRQKAARLEM
jgi:hypothetical protein